MKNPKIVRNMMALAVNTRPQAPPDIWKEKLYERKLVESYISFVHKINIISNQTLGFHCCFDNTYHGSSSIGSIDDDIQTVGGRSRGDIWTWSFSGHWSSGQDYGQGEGGHDDTRGDEVGQLSAGVTGAVIAVSPGQQAGDGTQQVEHNHCERIPITEN